MYQVVDWEQDIAGKWRIRVEIAGRTAMFKFDEWPDDETVQAEAARYEAMLLPPVEEPVNDAPYPE